jgi:hypothetical protein
LRAAVPLRAALPFLAAVPLRAAPAFLTAVPPLAALAWAAIRAFRARLDFEAVIPSFASGDFTAVPGVLRAALGAQRDRHLTPDCTPPVPARILRASSGFTDRFPGT